MMPRPCMPPPPPPETKIIPANRRPDFTTRRPSDPVCLPTSMPPLAVNEGPSRIREARLLPPSATLKRVTSTFVWARITWLGLSCVPLIRASAVRDGSVPPHMAAFSHAPSPPFHSAVVPAHDAGAPAAVKRQVIRTFTVWYANGDFVIEGYVDPREASRDEGLNRRPATRPKRRQTAIDWRTLAGQSIAVGPCGP